jgi:hypothetical protein
VKRKLEVTPETFAQLLDCGSVWTVKLTIPCYHFSLRVQHRSIKTCAHGTRCWIDLQMSYICSAVEIPFLLNPDVNPSTLLKLAARDPFVPPVVHNRVSRLCRMHPICNNLYPIYSLPFMPPSGVIFGLSTTVFDSNKERIRCRPEQSATTLFCMTDVVAMISKSLRRPGPARAHGI